MLEVALVPSRPTPAQHLPALSGLLGGALAAFDSLLAERGKEASAAATEKKKVGTSPSLSREQLPKYFHFFLDIVFERFLQLIPVRVSL